MRLKHVLPIVLSGVLLLLAWFPAQADPRLYDVEVIVFARQGNDDGETMVRPAAGSGQASGRFASDQFTELSADHYTLNRVRGGLAAASGYSVLFHRVWRQLAYNRSNAVDYPVHSIASNGRDSVEGSVTLIQERYLHLDIDLLLMQAGSGVVYSDAPGSRPAYRLREQRRIRSSEIHYFDHPRFGVIARVTPVTGTGAAVETSEPAPADANSDTAPVSEEEPVPADAVPAQ